MLCACEHTAEQHWKGTGHCLAYWSDNHEPCPCLKYTPHTTAQLSVVLDETGRATVMLLLADVKVSFPPDALVELGLACLSAAYHARGQEALAKYAQEHSIPLSELLA